MSQQPAWLPNRRVITAQTWFSRILMAIATRSKLISRAWVLALCLWPAGCVFGQLEEPLEVLGLQHRAQTHLENERWTEAITALESVVKITSRSSWPMNLATESTLTQLSDLYILIGDYTGAAEQARLRLQLVQRRPGSEREIANALLELGKLERLAGESSAEEHLQQALALRERLLGSEHFETANVHEALGIFYLSAESLTDARRHLERARAVKEKQRPPDHPDLISLYTNLAILYRTQGQLTTAEELLEQALAIEQRNGEVGQLGRASILDLLGQVQSDLSLWSEARASLERAIELTTLAVGASHPHLVTSLANLARIHLEFGELAEAESLLRRALGIARRQLGSDHPWTLSSAHALGVVLMRAERWKESRQLLTDTLAQREALLGPDHFDTASTRAVLGQLLTELGSADEGIGLQAEAIDTFVRTNRLDDPFVVQITLSALDAWVQEQMVQREPLEEEQNERFVSTLGWVGARSKEVYGDTSLELARVFEVSAKWALLQGDPQRAQELLQRARQIHKALQLDVHPLRASWFGNEAGVRRALGDLPGAAAAMARAHELFVKTFGPESVRAAQAKVDLASLYEVSGRIDDAREMLKKALAIEERALVRVLASGSEADQRRFLRTFYDSSILTVSFHARSAPDDPDALRLAMETVLRRKGRDLDAAVLRARLLRRGSEVIEQKRHELRRLRSRWARDLMSSELDTSAEWAKITDLERHIGTAIGAEPLPRVTLEGVQSALPDGTVLIEIVAFQAPDVTNYRVDSKRYLAYLLRNDGEPWWVDLGAAEPIEQAVATFHDAVMRRDPDVRRAARRLDALTLARLRPSLGDARVLVISPDDELLRVPFAALVDEGNCYLVENYSISYVTSGRDLVALGDAGARSRERPWIFANPDFGSGSNAATGVIGRLELQPLPGTEKEAMAIAALADLPMERVLLGSRATEAAVRAVRGPLFLHLATHGFLLPESNDSPADPLQRGLVRSGLALAGVGRFHESEPADDGFLSALELAEVDLIGTEVAALSACDTGRGKFMDGFGLFGLRRALVVAGAQTQLTSLWSADDRVTAQLMQSWYAQVLDGVSRGEAWRRTQLAALYANNLPRLGHPARGVKPLHAGDGRAAVEDASHPYYWAPFVVSGATGPLD